LSAAERQIPGQAGLLVLGLGNVLLADDGLGAAALARLERQYNLGDNVLVLDGGTLGMALLDRVAEAEDLIIVDAVRTDAPAGTLVRLDGADVGEAVRDRLSPHQVGVADLLDAARLIDRYPSKVTLLGLVPESLDLAVARSEPVNGGLDDLVEAIIREARSLGYEIVPKSAIGARAPCDAAARHFGM
jgi:hydrogenase maturation protease